MRCVTMPSSEETIAMIYGGSDDDVDSDASEAQLTTSGHQWQLASSPPLLPPLMLMVLFDVRAALQGGINKLHSIFLLLEHHGHKAAARTAFDLIRNWTCVMMVHADLAQEIVRLRGDA